jgi:hypothetical protein
MRREWKMEAVPLGETIKDGQAMRKPWRQRYADLDERLHASGLPYDVEAERGAVGALLLAPREHACRLSRRICGNQFYERGRGWLWDRMAWAVRQKVDFGKSGDRLVWLTTERIAERFREHFHGSLLKEMTLCMDYYWWHGPYYIDRIIAAAKVRARITRATNDLAEALNMADEGRRQTHKWL